MSIVEEWVDDEVYEWIESVETNVDSVSMGWRYSDQDDVFDGYRMILDVNYEGGSRTVYMDEYDVRHNEFTEMYGEVAGELHDMFDTVDVQQIDTW